MIKLNKLILFKYLMIFVIVIGIFLRFANLQQKVYNWDEVRSFSRLSGYVKDEVIADIFTGDIIGVSDIQKYQQPNQEKNLSDALQALSKNSEHPPLYYLMARLWQQFFGSPYSVRILSVLLSILVFPFLYYLCYQLFESPLTGWIASALLAVSPYHILLSQAARQYSLWTLVTIVSSLSLFIAVKTGKKSHWLTYTVTLIAGLYTHLLFVVLAFSQFIYTLLMKYLNVGKMKVMSLASFVIGIIAFSPWIVVVINNLNEVKTKTEWATKSPSSLSQIFWGNINNIGDLFYDINTNSRLEKLIAIIMTIAIVYSLYYICITQPIQTSSLIMLLIFTPFLVLLLPDLVLQEGVRSIQSRYLVPTYTGVLISLSYLIAAKITTENKLILYVTTVALSLILLLGIRSGVAISKTPDWDYLELQGTPISRNLEIAPLINQSQQPLVISSSFNHRYILSLSYLVKPQVKFQLFNQLDHKQFQKKLDILGAKTEYSDIFLYFLSPEHLKYISAKYPDITLQELRQNFLKIKGTN